jgi:hypothetical protein
MLTLYIFVMFFACLHYTSKLQRYESKRENIFFTLHHCWKFLEKSEQWKQERLNSKIEEMMNMKQRIAQVQLQIRKEFVEKKHSEKIRK